MAKAVHSTTTDMRLRAMVAAMADYGDITAESQLFGDHAIMRFIYRSPRLVPLTAVAHNWRAPKVSRERSRCVFALQMFGRDIIGYDSSRLYDPEQPQAIADEARAEWQRASQCAAKFPDLKPPASYPSIDQHGQR